MQFSADTGSLAGALGQVQEAAERRSMLLIVPHALVEACAYGMRLGTTDVEAGLREFLRGASPG